MGGTLDTTVGSGVTDVSRAFCGDWQDQVDCLTVSDCQICVAKSKDPTLRLVSSGTLGDGFRGSGRYEGRQRLQLE